MKRPLCSLVVALALVCAGTSAEASILTFNDVIVGATSYAFDGDGDGIADVIFSTTDSGGFNTVGPGPNMSYIREPGLEGTSLLNPDLRVDFLVGARDSLRFGFALDSLSEGPASYASFYVYDAGHNPLASLSTLGAYTFPDGVHPSSFPEGIVNVVFPGTAAYALFDFGSEYGRYIIDDFEGRFGTTEAVPEPGSMLLLGTGLVGLGRAWRKRRG